MDLAQQKRDMLRSQWRFGAEQFALGAAHHPRERLRGDENSAVRIERSFSVVRVTRNPLYEFAVRVENSTVGTEKMHAIGMISQCFMAHSAGHRATSLVLHEKPNAILL
jgi:hypothetical protein